MYFPHPPDNFWTPKKSTQQNTASNNSTSPHPSPSASNPSFSKNHNSDMSNNTFIKHKQKILSMKHPSHQLNSLAKRGFFASPQSHQQHPQNHPHHHPSHHPTSQITSSPRADPSNPNSPNVHNLSKNSVNSFSSNSTVSDVDENIRLDLMRQIKSHNYKTIHENLQLNSYQHNSLPRAYHQERAHSKMLKSQERNLDFSSSKRLKNSNAASQSCHTGSMGKHFCSVGRTFPNSRATPRSLAPQLEKSQEHNILNESLESSDNSSILSEDFYKESLKRVDAINPSREILNFIQHRHQENAARHPQNSSDSILLKTKSLNCEGSARPNPDFDYDFDMNCQKHRVQSKKKSSKVKGVKPSQSMLRTRSVTADYAAATGKKVHFNELAKIKVIKPPRTSSPNPNLVNFRAENLGSKFDPADFQNNNNIQNLQSRSKSERHYQDHQQALHKKLSAHKKLNMERTKSLQTHHEMIQNLNNLEIGSTITSREVLFPPKVPPKKPSRGHVKKSSSNHAISQNSSNYHNFNFETPIIGLEPIKISKPNKKLFSSHQPTSNTYSAPSNATDFDFQKSYQTLTSLNSPRQKLHPLQVMTPPKNSFLSYDNPHGALNFSESFQNLNSSQVNLGLEGSHAVVEDEVLNKKDIISKIKKRFKL